MAGGKGPMTGGKGKGPSKGKGKSKGKTGGKQKRGFHKANVNEAAVDEILREF